MNPLLFDQLNLVARDMEATLGFYRAAGLDIPEDAVWRTDSGAHHAQARLPNGVELEFDSEAMAKVYNHGWREPSGTSGRCVIGIRVDSREAVDQMHARLSGQGYQVAQPPWDAFWGSRYTIMIDPDGNYVGFMSPADAKFRSAPPAI